MTKVLTLIVSLLLCFGCDDEAVVAKVEHAIIYGGISGRATCVISVPRITGYPACNTAASVSVEYLRLIDGACLVHKGPAGYGFYSDARVIDRASTDAAGCSFTIDNPRGTTTLTIVDGEIEAVTQAASFDGDCTGVPGSPQLVATIPLDESPCSGENLEAFGVE